MLVWLFASCVAFGKFLNLSGPYFPVLQNKDDKGMLGEFSEMSHPTVPDNQAAFNTWELTCFYS